MSGGFYESDQALSEYLLFHYGSPDQQLPYALGPTDALEFPVRCVTECLDARRLPPNARALDVGCAVGRSAFELARCCERVVGVDYSARFIEAANHLKIEGSLPFRFVEEGALLSSTAATVPADIDRRRVTFERGDAQDLRADIGEFEVVLAANLIDRLRDPLRCLNRLPQLLRPGGQLILVSPYTWLEEYTPKENWIGGFVCAGQQIKTLDGLKRALQTDFQFASARNLPFLIREHARKFQWSVAEASLWIRQ